MQLVCQALARVSLAVAGIRVVEQRLNEELKNRVTIQLEGARKASVCSQPDPCSKLRAPNLLSDRLQTGRDWGDLWDDQWRKCGKTREHLKG